jgi:protocatechuate 3,4-dioxygenase beta subunit
MQAMRAGRRRMMRGAAVVVVAGILLPLDLSAQTRSAVPGQVRDGGRGQPPPAEQGPGTIEGTVVAGTGQPVGGGLVMVTGPQLPGGRSTRTDDRGRFSIGPLPAGRYLVTVNKPGHVTTSFGQRRPGTPGTPIDLRPGEQRSLSMRLPRGGVITGMVLDERGDPAINMQVQGMRFMHVGGRRRLQPVGGAQTDDRGIYRLHSLQPGDYLVCATPRGPAMMTDAQRSRQELEALTRSMQSFDGPDAAMVRKQNAARIAQLQAQVTGDTEPMAGYARVCYPGGSPSASSLMAIGAEEERTGADFQLQLTTISRVEGTVVGGTPDAGDIQVTLVNADDLFSGSDTKFSAVDGQRRFQFSDVAPGQYRILARTNRFARGPRRPGTPPSPTDGSSPQLWGTMDVQVSGQDVLNLAIALRPGVTVSGQIAFSGTRRPAPADLSRATAVLVPSNGFGGMSELANGAQANADGEGRFTIRDVFPGTYRFLGTAGGPGPGPGGGLTTGPGWMLESVMVGGQDVLDLPLEIRPGQELSGVVMTFTDRVASVAGVITNGSGRPVQAPTVLIYPADERYWGPDSRRIRTTRPGEDGAFTFRALPPGDYRLAALLDPEPGSFFEREFLEQVGSSALRVTLAAGEQKVQNLRVSVPE